MIKLNISTKLIFLYIREGCSRWFDHAQRRTPEARSEKLEVDNDRDREVTYIIVDGSDINVFKIF